MVLQIDSVIEGNVNLQDLIVYNDYLKHRICRGTSMEIANVLQQPCRISPETNPLS